MTNVVFTLEDGMFTGMRAEGHSGYAESGSDIVCATVTAAFGITECAVNDIAGVGVPVVSSKQGASLSFLLPKNMSEKQRIICDSAMRAAHLWLSENLRQYGAYVRISISKRR